MNRILSFSKTFNILLLLVLLSGCYYDKFEEEIPSDQVSFTADIQPLFDAHCSSCHPGLVANPDLSSGNSYNSITNGIYIVPNNIDASTLYQRLLGNPSIMPPSGSLSAAEINSVRSWIEQGALDN